MKTDALEIYEPKNLSPWTMPDSYCGEVWPGYYLFLSRNRDSGCLTESNFAKGLEAIGGESMGEAADDDGEPESLVQVVREGHWACGWIEWIAIHQDATEALRKADEIAGALESYPVLDESDFSEREQVEAEQVWKNCYNEKERIEYIRKYRGQFDFLDFAELLSNVRGKYFSGYASELIY